MLPRCCCRCCCCCCRRRRRASLPGETRISRQEIIEEPEGPAGGRRSRNRPGIGPGKPVSDRQRSVQAGEGRGRATEKILEAGWGRATTKPTSEKRKPTSEKRNRPRKNENRPGLGTAFGAAHSPPADAPRGHRRPRPPSGERPAASRGISGRRPENHGRSLLRPPRPPAGACTRLPAAEPDWRGGLRRTAGFSGRFPGRFPSRFLSP